MPPLWSRRLAAGGYRQAPKKQGPESTTARFRSILRPSPEGKATAASRLTESSGKPPHSKGPACSSRTWVPLLPLLFLAGCGPRLGSPERPLQLENVAASAGITFRHTNGASGRYYLPETIGSGCAFLDYDGDGHLDLFLVNSGPLPGFSGTGRYLPALYRGDGKGRFTDVTRAAGLAVPCYGVGCAVGDYDNDGYPDLYMTALGPNHLFHNKGDGTFSDVTQHAGVGDHRFSASAAWFDYDRDGKLDLFVGNYVRWSPQTNVVQKDPSGVQHLGGVGLYPGERSTLYRNNGDGTFTDVTRAAGLVSKEGGALGVAVWDYDNDGWPDLFVANDMRRNLLYRNNRNGTFSEIALATGLAYGANGEARAGMGVDTVDELGTGTESVLVGNFSEQALALFRPPSPNPAAGGAQYQDQAAAAGLREASLPFLTFGVLFADLDLDGRPDIIAANGHIDENVASLNASVAFAERMLFFHNEGEGQYRERGEAVGLKQAIVGRGLALGDFDEDGDPDLLVSANNGPPLLLRNTPPTGRHWLQVRVVGTKSNRDGLGTRVEIEAGGQRQSRWIRSGSSYASQSERAAFFGLGSAARVDRLTLHWPSGGTETLQGLPADRRLLLREGAGPVTSAGSGR